MQKEPGAGYGAGERTALLVLVRQAELGVFLSAVKAGVADGAHARHPRRQLCRSLLHRTTSQHSRHCSLAIVCSVWSGVSYPVDGLLHLDKLLRRRSQAVHPTHGDGVCRKLLFERDKPEPANLSGVPIDGQEHVLDLPVLSEVGTEVRSVSNLKLQKYANEIQNL